MKKTPVNPTEIQKAITKTHDEMESYPSHSDEYAKMATQLQKLYAIKAEDRPKGIKPEVWLPVAGNLTGIAFILGHEHAHVIATKALGFVMKTKI